MQIVVSSTQEIFSWGVVAALQQEFQQLSIESRHPKEEILPLGKSLLLMDIDSHRDNYADKIAKWKGATEPAMIMLFAAAIENHMLEQILELEVEGFLLKDVSVDELHRSIYQLLSEQKYYDQRIIQHLISKKNAMKTGRKDPASSLTRKQKQILKLIAEENTNKEIAAKLGISSRTVDGHRYRLIKQFGVKNTAGLIRHAINHGLIKES